MFLFASLVVLGFVLLGREAVRDDKRPLVLLGAMGLIGLGCTLSFFGSATTLDAIAGLAAWSGIGLVAAAGLIAKRQGPARSWFVIGIILLSIGAIAFGYRSLRSQTSEWLLELGPDDQIEEVAATLAEYDATWERAFPMIDLSEDEDLAQVYLIRVPANRAEALGRELLGDVENVDHLEENLTLSLDLPAWEETTALSDAPILENDPLVRQQWALESVGGHAVHRLLADRSAVRIAEVAIVDTGVDSRHEDISAVFVDGPATEDPNGHGSHCAGIAGATTNNGLGIASLNWEGRFVRVSSYSALDGQGIGSVESTSDAILEAAESGADVISLSLGAEAPTTPKVMTDAIAYALAQGAIVIAAAGNSNMDAISHVPSNIDGVVAVSAVDHTLRKASFSNTNTSLSRPIAAPGVDILSLQNNGGYTSKSGTSMATPLVAGLAGIMVSLKPQMTADEFYRIIHDSGQEAVHTARVGRVIDAEAAVRSLLGDEG